MDLICRDYSLGRAALSPASLPEFSCLFGAITHAGPCPEINLQKDGVASESGPLASHGGRRTERYGERLARGEAGE